MTYNQNFDDIRPYTDADIPGVVNELLNDNEFLRAIAALRFGGIPNFAYLLLKPI